MLVPPRALRMLSVAFMIGGSMTASGQDYPNRIIRIFTSPAGGGTDASTRIITQAASGGSLGQPLIVENRPVAIARDSVVKSPADGYTLLVQDDFIYLDSLLRSASPTSYDPRMDFAGITMVSIEPQILVIHPSLPVKSVSELIALAKAKPGEINYASNGASSTAGLAGTLFKVMTSVNIVQVPYKTTGIALNELMSGFVQLRFAGGGGVAPHIKSGRLRALAVTSAQPSTLYPTLPTIAATVPGYSMVSMLGLFAPAKTPPAIINRLNQEFVRGINQPDVKAKLLNTGTEVVAGPPDQLNAYLRNEASRWGKVIQDAGIKTE